MMGPFPSLVCFPSCVYCRGHQLLEPLTEIGPSTPDTRWSSGPEPLLPMSSDPDLTVLPLTSTTAWVHDHHPRPAIPHQDRVLRSPPVPVFPAASQHTVFTRCALTSTALSHLAGSSVISRARSTLYELNR